MLFFYGEIRGSTHSLSCLRGRTGSVDRNTRISLTTRGSKLSEKEKEELDDMPIWQNHEQRITALEVTTSNIQSEFKEVKEKIDKGNNEQQEKLDTIDKRLMDEFFNKKNATRNNVWKLLISLVGGGSFLYVIVEKLMEVL